MSPAPGAGDMERGDAGTKNPGVDLAPLIDRLALDPRVLGIARLATESGHRSPAADDAWQHLLIATTWDGLVPLSTTLRDLAALIVETEDAAISHHTTELRLLTPAGERVELSLERMAEIKPSERGETARPLHDPKELLAQWVKWSCGRRRPEPGSDDDSVHDGAHALDIDAALRSWSALLPGARRVLSAGHDEPLRSTLAHALRRHARRLTGDHPAESALRERVHAALAAMPQHGEARIEGGTDPRARFLAIADEEGVLGDRMLLDAAEAHLHELSGRDPIFTMGFVLATFDKVEARYALGDAVGGCQPPMLPGIYVGIGITPADAIEFWSAPCVSEAVTPTACIADTGVRTAVDRDAGKDALIGALQSSIESAYDVLPALLRRVRGAHRDVLGDPVAVVRALHLPRSHVAAAGEHGALEPGVNRLFCALAIARAATDMEPLAARKLELAAGRLLAVAAEASE